MAVDAMSDNLSATVTDDRFSGWRARLIHDDCAGEPDGDALAPALLASSRGRPRLAKGVYLPGHAEQIVAAWLQLADRDRMDRERETSPMRIAPDAVVIRTDKMSVDETVDIVVAMCGLELMDVG